ncbi:MAG TPA: glycosyltransferase [Anaerolineales bacterium]|jgi:predicted glycosyltransferase
MSIARPRIMLYSHDTYGLGHLRRSLSVATQLSKDLPTASQLLITGSIVPGAFALPERLDMVKLPALSKRSDGRYKARTLPMSLGQISEWRSQMILQAAQAYQPDLLLVDKSPAGVRKELLPTLSYLKSWLPGTRLVLGMRDIEDSPQATLAEWQAEDVRKLHEQVYDCIILYGEREVFDPVVEYQMSPAASRKLIPVGYLGNVTPTKTRDEVRRELQVGDLPLIVVTVGGGGDGFDLIRTYLEALQSGDLAAGAAHTLIVTGPLMAKGKKELLRQAAQFENLSMLEFTHELVNYMAAADLVVSMAGYNTVREALTLNCRLLLVPRIRPRVEQLMRARALAERNLARFVSPDELSPQRLAQEMRISLAQPRPRMSLNFNGVQAASELISNLLAGNQPIAGNYYAHQPLAVLQGAER